jgi:proteic killer suppression protein
VIKSFAHKGLEDLFYKGSTKGIQTQHADKLRRLLDRLDAAGVVQDMDYPGSGLHQLKGDLKHHWSVKVSGNWRLTIRFENGDAYIVNYQDYH